jgi:hypothetical protein
MRTVFVIGIFFLFLGQSTTKLSTDSIKTIESKEKLSKKPYPTIAKEKSDSIVKLSKEIKSINSNIREQIKLIKDERRKQKENTSDTELLGDWFVEW